MQKCFICNGKIAEYLPAHGFDGYKVDCAKCGRYDIADTCTTNYEQELNAIQRANISGWIRNASKLRGVDAKLPLLTTTELPKLMQIQTPTVEEKAHILLKNISKSHPIAGQNINVLMIIIEFADYQFETKPPEILKTAKYFEGLCSAVNNNELKYIIKEYLIAERQLLKYINNEVLITPKGWHYLSENPLSPSETAFVAMSFADKFDTFYQEVICKAVVRAGWKPLRLKEERHNNYITSEIISGIKRSKFMIADFTENCAGAYYEAGLAKGLGMPVIHMVNESYLDGSDPDKKLHFDTQQIYHFPWKSGDEKTDAEKLFYHIVDTVGIGPVYKNL